MRTKVRVGLVGVGAMGDIHLRLLSRHPQAEVVGVCDIDPKVRSRIEKDYSFGTYSDYQTLVEEKRPGALIIATPPHLHAEQALYTLGKGLYVLLEKTDGCGACRCRTPLSRRGWPVDDRF